TRQPTTPNSSAITAKMKSLCPLGSRPHLRCPWPSPTPNQPPLEIAYNPWKNWYAAPSRFACAGSRNTVSRATRYGATAIRAAMPSTANPHSAANTRNRTPAAQRRYEAQHIEQHHEAEAHDQHDPAGTAVRAHRQPLADPERQQPDDGPQQLLGDRAERVAALGVRLHAGRREHHDQPDDEQQP